MTTANDATQTTGALDDPQNTEAKPAERELSEREKMLDAISVDREGFQEPSPVVETEPNQDAGQLQAQLSEETLSPDALDKIHVKVKIDGVESEVTVADLQRQYQKNGAAERRLEEATRLLNEARAQAAQAATAVGFQKPEEPSNDAANQQATDADQLGKNFLAAMFEGDEQKALDALKLITQGRPQAPTPDVSQLAAQLTPAIKQQLSFDSALERFKTDYPEIVADPYLADLADRHLDAEVKAGKPFTEALEEAGKRTRDWLSSKGVVAAAPQPTIGRNEKLERKAGIEKIPALNTKATTVQEPVQSASDIINEMRKSRGLSL